MVPRPRVGASFQVPPVQERGATPKGPRSETTARAEPMRVSGPWQTGYDRFFRSKFFRADAALGAYSSQEKKIAREEEDDGTKT